jgi:hypothetical protein
MFLKSSVAEVAMTTSSPVTPMKFFHHFSTSRKKVEKVPVTLTPQHQPQHEELFYKIFKNYFSEVMKKFSI